MLARPRHGILPSKSTTAAAAPCLHFAALVAAPRPTAAARSPHVNALGPDAKVIVPVPSSKTTLQSDATFRTAIIAQKLAAACPNTTSFPELRFEEEQLNCREEGGPREAAVLYPLLRCKPLPTGHIVLLDDVLTGGGHLTAAAWIIEDQGRTVAKAICCGRSLEAKLGDPFTVPPESIDITRE